ncbi:negative elongation factor E-like [Saccoglossus kowalevskii]|uniref:Negative elongation factor E n=1 Tax=Saccoglossus kowalevskii TaxID=10224 RepID=A0ABM0GPX9_SACKO|nr:PREDICTED: negative elongation factor E-like [Saccoglossus kowalevskii]
MGFPSTLTEEEEALKKKYVLLRKKKKALVQLKQSKRQANSSTTATQPKKNRVILEPVTEEAKEAAKEAAKKLVAAGAIKIDSGSKKVGFKRSRNLEHKLKDPEKLSFQPFHPSSTPSGDESTPSPSRTSVKPLYESFVSTGTSGSGHGSLSSRDTRQGSHFDDRRERRKGNTVYVSGHGITESVCQKAFTTIGKIVNINMEQDRNCGFVTFEKMEMADKAIEEINGTLVEGVHLKVSMARRQPMLESATDNSPWSSVAAGISKNAHKDRRQMVVYDADDLFK